MRTRMRRYNPFPLFFLLPLLVSISMSSISALQQIHYTPNWLQVGCSATYEFGRGDYAGPVRVFFNESRAWGKDLSGNYTWTVIAIENGKALIKVMFDLIIPGSETYEEYVSKVKAHENPSVVEYMGKEFVKLAEGGNFSFVKMLPQDQIDEEKVCIADNPQQGVYVVQFWGKFHISEVFYITLDLYNLTMIDERGSPWGKWLLWSNPVFYPVDREVKEIALYNWSGRLIERNVTYKLPGKQPWWLIETPVGNFTEYYLGQIFPLQIQDPKLVGENEKAYLMQTATYEPRTGLLLNTLSGNYVDDILAQKLGILQLNPAYFWLTKLEGIELKPETENGINFANCAPYLVVVILAVSAVLVYWSYRKRSRR